MYDPSGESLFDVSSGCFPFFGLFPKCWLFSLMSDKTGLSLNANNDMSRGGY